MRQEEVIAFSETCHWPTHILRGNEGQCRQGSQCFAIRIALQSRNPACHAEIAHHGLRRGTAGSLCCQWQTAAATALQHSCVCTMSSSGMPHTGQHSTAMNLCVSGEDSKQSIFSTPKELLLAHLIPVILYDCKQQSTMQSIAAMSVHVFSEGQQTVCMVNAKGMLPAVASAFLQLCNIKQ